MSHEKKEQGLFNGDVIRSMSNSELAKLLCSSGWMLHEIKECEAWLERPAEELARYLEEGEGEW